MSKDISKGGVRLPGESTGDEYAFVNRFGFSCRPPVIIKRF